MAVSFSFGGTTLASLGVVTMIDDVLDIAQRRGENQVIPYRNGRTHVNKFYDERKITIGISIQSANGTTQDSTLDTAKKLFSPQSQQVLAMTMNDASVRNANATVDAPLQMEWIHDSFARMVIEFTLAEPFFRSNTSSTDNTTTISTTDTAMTVANVGTMTERDPTILLTGPLTNPTISTTDGVSVTYTGAISSTDTVTIGTLNGEYYATHSTSGNVIGNVTHAGSSALLTLQPGTNNLQVTCTVTGGTVKISFYPPFI
jgi:phage-related protein